MACSRRKLGVACFWFGHTRGGGDGRREEIIRTGVSPVDLGLRLDIGRVERIIREASYSYGT